MSDNIFEAKTVQTSNVRILFELLKDLIVECNMIITKDKIKIVELNTTQVALIHVKLDASVFEKFHFEGDKPLVLGIHTENFYKIIKTLKHDETFSMCVKRSDQNSLYIRKENNTRNSTNTFKLDLHAIPCENYEIPSVDFQTIINMSSEEFQRKCKAFSSLGGKVFEIKNIGDCVYFSGNGEFCTFEGVVGSSGTTTFESSEEVCTGVVQGLFDVKYLLLFSKAEKLSNTVGLYLKNDYPLIMSYKIGTLGILKFIVSAIAKEN
jgi:proliferating cell nuclear antigen PCNA